MLAGAEIVNSQAFGTPSCSKGISERVTIEFEELSRQRWQAIVSKLLSPVHHPHLKLRVYERT